MKKHEFRWTILPKPHHPMQGKQEQEGFEVEWAGDQLVIRSGYTDAPEDEVRGRAEAIAVSHCHAMGYRLGQKLTPALARIERTPAPGGTSDIGLPLEDNAAHLRDKVEVELSYKADAVLVISAEDVNLDEIFVLAEKARRDPALHQMLDFIDEFREDPEKKLAPLYNIIEIAETQYGGRREAAQALGMSDNALKRAKGIMNDKSILTSRHPGEEKGTKRKITDKELAHCIKVAQAIINAQAARG